MNRAPVIRYRCPTDDDNPAPGYILIGQGPRVRRAYRVLTTKQIRPGRFIKEGDAYLASWKLTVEPMSAERGREEIASGTPYMWIKWDSRGKGKRRK